MYKQKVFVTKDLISELEVLLQGKITNYQTHFQSKGSSGKVIRVDVEIDEKSNYKLIIKPESKEFKDFYSEVLFNLDLVYPKVYGFIDKKVGRVLAVQDFIEHKYPDWGNTERYYSVLNWLINKDKKCISNIEKLEKAKGSLGKIKFYGLETWFSTITQTYEKNLIPELDRKFYKRLVRHRKNYQICLDVIEQPPVKTLIHGDLQMNNVLFSLEDKKKLYVIDWTQPRLGSTSVDLAQLVDHAPESIKRDLVFRYKKEISVKNFDKEFEAAMIIRDLSYFSWMALMYNSGQGSEIHKEELERVINKMQKYL